MDDQLKTEKAQTEATDFFVHGSNLCRFGFHSSTASTLIIPFQSSKYLCYALYRSCLVVIIASAHTLVQDAPLDTSAKVPAYGDHADTSLSAPSSAYERFAYVSAVDLQTDSLETASELCGYYFGASLRYPIHAHQFISASLI